MGYWASQQNLSSQQIISPAQQADPQQVGRLGGQQTCGQQIPFSSQQMPPGQHFGCCGRQQCSPSQQMLSIDVQGLLQLPQCSESVNRSTHSSVQQVNPVSQGRQSGPQCSSVVHSSQAPPDLK